VCYVSRQWRRKRPNRHRLPCHHGVRLRYGLLYLVRSTFTRSWRCPPGWPSNSTCGLLERKRLVPYRGLLSRPHVPHVYVCLLGDFLLQCCWNDEPLAITCTGSLQPFQRPEQILHSCAQLVGGRFAPRSRYPLALLVGMTDPQLPRGRPLTVCGSSSVTVSATDR